MDWYGFMIFLVLIFVPSLVRTSDGKNTTNTGIGNTLGNTAVLPIRIAIPQKYLARA
jgi:hypothetical protein